MFRRSNTNPRPAAPPREASQTDPNRHTLGWASNVDDAVTWLKNHGYRAALAAAPGSTHAGLVFSRPGEPAFLAVIGETLVYDGEHVTVERPASPKPNDQS